MAADTSEDIALVKALDFPEENKNKAIGGTGDTASQNDGKEDETVEQPAQPSQTQSATVESINPSSNNKDQNNDLEDNVSSDVSNDEQNKNGDKNEKSKELDDEKQTDRDNANLKKNQQESKISPTEEERTFSRKYSTGSLSPTAQTGKISSLVTPDEVFGPMPPRKRRSASLDTVHGKSINDYHIITQ